MHVWQLRPKLQLQLQFFLLPHPDRNDTIELFPLSTDFGASPATRGRFSGTPGNTRAQGRGLVGSFGVGKGRVGRMPPGLLRGDMGRSAMRIVGEIVGIIFAALWAFVKAMVKAIFS